jgi:hypothetical protein
MKPIILLSFIIVASSPAFAQQLFNGKDLTGWDTYLRAYVDDPKTLDPTVGLNKDPYHVFSVVSEDGPAIRISGEYFGGLSTTSEYSDYHLIIEFKWGIHKIKSFQNRKRDSGLLYHAVGPHGVDYGAWMRSQEFQVQEGDVGDYWGVSGGIQDVPARQINDGTYVYYPKGGIITFKDSSKVGRRCRKSSDFELPSGQWNKIELYCLGDTSIHVVNGHVVMILYHSRQRDKGIEKPLTKGKIQLQSEGCEVFYRKIEIQAISKLPPDLLNKP